MEEGVDEVSDEPLYRDRVCGIDIGKAGMVATIRVPSDKDPARRAQAGQAPARPAQAGPVRFPVAGGVL